MPQNTDNNYQVLARKYRPQTFGEVLGQDPIITTLKNAMRSNRLAHAYLFCGSRGTGKTTLARVLAKALNCEEPQDFEPCNNCASCKEITAGHSLDVLEIDGASHRGIDDIRQINDTVGYASSGKMKIYIIDEVHMLTKEAFNALLKTLEEPPPNVKFVFATTEPHKVLPTIMSRCQRFNLNRIATDTIVNKLTSIVQDLGIDVEEEALLLVAKRADGGLRDAESLLDQILVFHEGKITAEAVASILGVVTKDVLFELDVAAKEARFSFVFDCVHQLFSEGKDLLHFTESLTEHFRNLLLIKLSGKDAPHLLLTESEREKYTKSAALYSKEQCLNLLDYLVEEQNKMRFAPSPKIALEAILLHICRIHQRLPIEFLVRKLTELENSTTDSEAPSPKPAPAPIEASPPKPTPAPIEASPPKPAPAPIKAAPPKETPPPKPTKAPPSVTEDPTPSPADLGIKETPAKISAEKQRRYDTLLQFTAVELEGTVRKG